MSAPRQKKAKKSARGPQFDATRCRGGSSRGGKVADIEVALSEDLALKAEGDDVSSGRGEDAALDSLKEVDWHVGGRDGVPLLVAVD
jgi:hypothetical protein